MTAPRYWAELPTLLPWRYKVRTRLTDLYVLQVTGAEDGIRHRLKLLRITPRGHVLYGWSRRFKLDGETGSDAAMKQALAILRRTLDRDKSYILNLAGFTPTGRKLILEALDETRQG